MLNFCHYRPQQFHRVTHFSEFLELCKGRYYYALTSMLQLVQVCPGTGRVKKIRIVLECHLERSPGGIPMAGSQERHPEMELENGIVRRLFNRILQLRDGR